MSFLLRYINPILDRYRLLLLLLLFEGHSLKKWSRNSVMTCLRQLKTYLFKTGLCYLCHSAFAHILTNLNFKRIWLFKMTLFRCATRRFLYCFALYSNCTIISTFLVVSFRDKIGTYWSFPICWPVLVFHTQLHMLYKPFPLQLLSVVLLPVCHHL